MKVVNLSIRTPGIFLTEKRKTTLTLELVPKEGSYAQNPPPHTSSEWKELNETNFPEIKVLTNFVENGVVDHLETGSLKVPRQGEQEVNAKLLVEDGKAWWYRVKARCVDCVRVMRGYGPDMADRILSMEDVIVSVGNFNSYQE